MEYFSITAFGKKFFISRTSQSAEIRMRGKKLLCKQCDQMLKYKVALIFQKSPKKNLKQFFY